MAKINRHGEESTTFNTISDLINIADRCEECGNYEGWCDCDEPQESEEEGREYNPDLQVNHWS